MSYFEGAQHFSYNGHGGRFGPDYSRHTNNGPVSHTDDYSQHSTIYGTYVNRGQHAENRGTINNYGPGDAELINNISTQRPGPPGKAQSCQHYLLLITSGGDEDFRYGPMTGSRPSNSNPNPPDHRHRQSYDDFGGEELTNEDFDQLSPGMQRYVQSLIQQRNTSQAPNERSEREIHEHMARMNIDDAEPSSKPSNAPRRTGSSLPPGARSFSPHSSGFYQDDFEDDRRTVITNINSGNLNSTTVVDSHNDNSTRTEISRGLGKLGLVFALVSDG